MKFIAALSALAMLGSTAVPATAATEITKDETVYVVTEADGSQSDVTVSDHLINESGLERIQDKTNLTDIENVKGDETFEEGSGDNIEWAAGGKDIFYQGTTDREIPVKLGISYFLDGEEVDGSALDGASGDLKIVINYRNTATDNKGTTVPFVALTGFIANDENFTDIEIDHGKVIDDGDRKVVVAMAAPGLDDLRQRSGKVILLCRGLPCSHFCKCRLQNYKISRLNDSARGDFPTALDMTRG